MTKLKDLNKEFQDLKYEKDFYLLMAEAPAKISIIAQTIIEQKANVSPALQLFLDRQVNIILMTEQTLRTLDPRLDEDRKELELNLAKQYINSVCWLCKTHTKM